MNNNSHSAVLELTDDLPSSEFIDSDLHTQQLSASASRSPVQISRVASIALVVSIAALLIALAWPLLLGQIYTADDLGWFHLPMRAFYAQQLAHGQSFDWCPNIFCGFYLTGEGQVGSYHPLHWLLYRTLPLQVAFDLECWLSYPFMLAGMYLFLRRWKLRPEAAAFGAMAFTFGSFNLLHFMHVNGVAIVAHLPWLLWAIDVAFRRPGQSTKLRTSSKSRRLALCTIALLTGSQLLLGYPQYVFFSLAVEAGYVLLLGHLAAVTASTTSLNLCRWMLAALIGFLIGGVQLLPTFDALQHSVRQSAAVEGFATQGSMPLLNWMQLFTPYLFATRVVGGITHEFAMYLGAVPFALAIWWLCCGNRRGQFRILTNAALVTAALALLWMLGELGPLAWLQEHLPLVNKFRLPSRAIVVFELAMSMLATLGFAALLAGIPARGTRNIGDLQPETPLPQENRAQKNRKNRAPDCRQLLWALPLISAAFTLVALGYWREYLGPYPLVALGPLLMALAVFLILRAASGARWALASLILLSALDLGAYGISYCIYGHAETLPQFIGKIDAPPGFPSERVALDLAAGAEAAPGQKIVRAGNQILLQGWKRADGYAGLDPAKQLDYHNLAALQVAGVQWIAADAAKQIEDRQQFAELAAALPQNAPKKPSVPSKTGEVSNNNAGWYWLSHSQPKAWLVSKTIPSDNPAVDIGHLSLADEALVDQNIPSLSPSASSDTTAPRQAEVNTLVDQPGNFAFEANCPNPQFLVVSESFHPGWQATIDQQTAQVFRADGDFLGVSIPAGNHQILLKFQPKSLEYGRLASGFGLGLLVVLVAAAGWPARKHHQFLPTNRS